MILNHQRKILVTSKYLLNYTNNYAWSKHDLYEIVCPKYTTGFGSPEHAKSTRQFVDVNDSELSWTININFYALI